MSLAGEDSEPERLQEPSGDGPFDRVEALQGAVAQS